MALAHVQSATRQTATNAPAVVSLSPSAGNALVVYVSQTASNIRTYTVEDNIDGTTGWTEAVYSNPGRAVGIWVKANVPSGITSITVTASGTSTFTAGADEFSGFGASITVDASDSLAEGGSSNSHACSTAGVTSANEVIAACAALLTATATECDPGSGYTESPTGAASNNVLFQFQRFGSGATNEVGAWSNTGTARVGNGAIVLLSGAGGGGGGDPEGLLIGGKLVGRGLLGGVLVR